MRTFIQFKDDVAFSTVQTQGETEGIEVFTEEPEQFLKKKYIDGTWVDAPVIRYAILDETDTVVQIDKTWYPSLVGSNPVVTDPSVGINWKWDGVKFISPEQANVGEFIDAEIVEPTQSITN